MNTKLTEREQEVLEQVITGKTNKEIAEELTVTEHTIKAHIASILRKIGGKRRIDLAMIAVSKGLIQINIEQ